MRLAEFAAEFRRMEQNNEPVNGRQRFIAAISESLYDRTTARSTRWREYYDILVELLGVRSHRLGSRKKNFAVLLTRSSTSPVRARI